MPHARTAASARNKVVTGACLAISAALLASFAPPSRGGQAVTHASGPLNFSASDTVRTAPARADRAFRSDTAGFANVQGERLPLPEPSLQDLTPEEDEPATPAEQPATPPESEQPRGTDPTPAPPQQSAGTWVRPGTGSFSSGFGKRWGKMHKGVDLAAPTGSPIYAAADGVVVFAGPASGFGRLVKIRHDGGLETWYGHMSVILVNQGDRVKAGQLIAKVGNAGHSTGPHLHFETHVNGNAVDPVPFMRKRGVKL